MASATLAAVKAGMVALLEWWIAVLFAIGQFDLAQLVLVVVVAELARTAELAQTEVSMAGAACEASPQQAEIARWVEVHSMEAAVWVHMESCKIEDCLAHLIEPASQVGNLKAECH
jgi:hypothetical protein